jgi:hypothetical protein
MYINSKENIDRHEGVLAASIQEADCMANQNLSIEATNAKLDEIEDEDVRRMTKLLIFSLDEAQSVADSRKFNKDRAIEFNHALKDVIRDYDDVSLSPQALIRRMTEFSYAKISVPERKKKELQETYESDFLGMWHEQAFENLLCAANIRSGETSSYFEKKGIDIFAQINITDWVAIDVKSSENGINYAVEEQEYTKFSSKKRIKPLSFSGEASYRQPVINVLHGQQHFILSVDYGLGRGLPMHISPPDYRQFDKQSVVDLSNQLIDYMRTENIDLYVKSQSSFIPKRTATNIGAKANIIYRQ